MAWPAVSAARVCLAGVRLNAKVTVAVETQDPEALKAVLVELNKLGMSSERVEELRVYITACDRPEEEGDAATGVKAAAAHVEYVLAAIEDAKVDTHNIAKH